MNDIEAVVPQLLAQALLSLRNFNVMPMLVNSDYSSMFAEKGDTIDIPTPGPVAVRDVTPGPVPGATPDDATTKIQVPLDQWKEAPFYLDDKDMQSVMDGYIPRKATYAVAALMNTVNRHILDTGAVGIPTYIGVPGTELFDTSADLVGTETATSARRALNNQQAPLDDRVAVVDPDAAAAALNLRAFQDASWAASASAIMDGSIDRKLGFRWYEDQQVSNVDAPADAALAVNGSPGVGATSVPLDGGTGAQTLQAGATLTIAGHTTVYTVTEDTTATGGDYGSVPIIPALTAAPADGAVVTVAPTTKHNLAFSRECIAFVNRPLTMVEGMGNVIQTAQDDVTGLTMRLEVSREHKRTKWSFDMLYGCRVVRPELGVRMLA